MANRDGDVSSSSVVRCFSAWQREYEGLLSSADLDTLWKRVEVAEPKMRLRLDAVATAPELQEERLALVAALANLGKIKKDLLRFK